MSGKRRLPTPEGPAEQGFHRDLAYTLWQPAGEPWGGLVIIHGAHSRKENHHDMARVARDSGLAAVCFDQRGHGETPGSFDARMLDDVAAIAELVPRPLALRGSSLGGFLAIAAAERAGADAIAAICPAPGFGLAGLFPDLAGFFSEHDLGLIVERSRTPLLLIHAEGDERVPFRLSVDLHERSAAERKRLILVPGGHHRSVQHDLELQGETIRFLRRALT